jgi:hypothetical protein
MEVELKLRVGTFGDHVMDAPFEFAKSVDHLLQECRSSP